MSGPVMLHSLESTGQTKEMLRVPMICKCINCITFTYVINYSSFWKTLWSSFSTTLYLTKVAVGYSSYREKNKSRKLRPFHTD